MFITDLANKDNADNHVEALHSTQSLQANPIKHLARASNLIAIDIKTNSQSRSLAQSVLDYNCARSFDCGVLLCFLYQFN